MQLEEDIPAILCKLEKIFPPSFFYSKEHLLIHLPVEAILCGQPQFRWMYLFKRFLGDLKQFFFKKRHTQGIQFVQHI